MKRTFLFTLSLSLMLCGSLSAQMLLPKGHAPGEREIDRTHQQRASSASVFTNPPDFEVRTAAEWEEIESLIITWAGFERILKQITFHARQECEVIIIAQDEEDVQDYLFGNNSGGAPFPNLDNVTILEEPFNSIWGRDYGGHTAYQDDVGDRILVDWIYNRNRPLDDTTPEAIAAYKDIPLYSTTEEPYDLMATGGNFMSDGLGTGFSSELILEENEGGFAWWGAEYPDHTESEIDEIVQEFMGLERYIKMESLPYDGIHHIDMHMKLLDEETIIVGEYPQGVSDGPQINANIEYVLDNFDSAFDTPYEIVRVEMPPQSGIYPWQGGDYRTYTNMVFVNKTVLVPTYQAFYDGPALAIIQEQLPGYNVVGIECNDIIQLSGAIHCITKAVGVADPMLIVHDHLEDTEETMMPYVVDARIQHRSGITNGTLHYRVDGGSFQSVAMSMTDMENDIWSADIPAQSPGSIIDYYVEGLAESGKQQVRPMTAPEGYWTFEVLGDVTGIEDNSSPIAAIYPNPANSITVIRLNNEQNGQGRIELRDMMGRLVQVVHEGSLPRGEQRIFLDAATLTPSVYQVVVSTRGLRFSQPFMVR